MADQAAHGINPSALLARIALGIFAVLAIAYFVVSYRAEFMVKRLVTSALIDPTSPIVEVDEDSSWRDGVICGSVNAKNRLGAYTGAVPFMVTTPIENSDTWGLHIPNAALSDDVGRIGACCSALRASGRAVQAESTTQRAIDEHCRALTPAPLHRAMAPSPVIQ